MIKLCRVTDKIPEVEFHPFSFDKTTEEVYTKINNEVNQYYELLTEYVPSVVVDSLVQKLINNGMVHGLKSGEYYIIQEQELIKNFP